MSDLQKGLKIMAQHPSYSMAFHEKFYGDDDDEPTHGNWVIWEEGGSVNDRDWTVVSFGPTPKEAIEALLSKAQSHKPNEGQRDE